MPDALQAMAEFPGVVAVESCSVTWNHGISPSTIQLRIHPQDKPIDRIGDLILTYGHVRIEIVDCLCEAADYEFNASGQIVALTLLDRRWRWKYGFISGRYNIRTDDGKIVKAKKSIKGDILSDTEIAPQDMASKFLDAMGEITYDVGQLPNDARPLFEGEVEVPARALANLCEYFAFRIVLQLDPLNAVKLYKEGQGKELSSSDPWEHFSTTLAPILKPNKLTIVGNHTRYQDDFDTIPVALDINGEIKLVTDLSYWPKRGGKALGINEVPIDVAISLITDAKAQAVARQSLGRWFQIKSPLTLANYGKHSGHIDNLYQILPIENKQVIKQDVLEQSQEIPPLVYGVWVAGLANVKSGNNTDTAIAKIKKGLQGNDLATYLIPVDFELEEKFGIVKFKHIITKNTGTGANAFQTFADIRLRTAVSVRDPDTGSFIRYSKERELSGSDNNENRVVYTQPIVRAERHDEITLAIYNEGDKSKSNQEDIDKEADYYLDAMEKEYQQKRPLSVQYVGLIAIDLDGAIQSVTWTFGPNDGGTTVAHYNDDPGSPTVLPYKLRRINEQNKAASAAYKQIIPPSQLARILRKASR